MKAFVAACIAAGILWAVDVKLNDDDTVSWLKTWS